MSFKILKDMSLDFKFAIFNLNHQTNPFQMKMLDDLSLLLPLASFYV